MARGDKRKDELPKAKLNKENFVRSLRLFKYIGENKWKFLLGMFFLLGTAAVGLIFPLVSGKMFGFFGETGKSPEIIKAELLETGKLLLIILVIQGSFSFGRVLTFAQVTENMLKNLRLDTFKRLVQMPMEFFSKSHVSELSSRIATDINVISEAFSMNIAELIRQSVVGIGGLCLIIYYVPWAVAKWFLIIIPPLVIVAVLFGRRIRKFSRSMQDKIAESNTIVGEALTGITNVKSFTNESFEINRYEKATAGIRDFGIRYGIFRGTFFAFIITCMFGAIFFILYQMLLLKNSQQLTAEEFGKFMMLSLFVAGSLGGLPEQIASIQRALGATERVFELIDGKIEVINTQVNKTNRSINGEIEFNNVEFSYPTRKEHEVLKSVSFKARQGETIAVVGPSGSGKSTIASLILRFYEVQNGEIKVDGKNINDYGLTELRSNMAIVPQDVLLFGGSIKENIAYGKPNATPGEIIEAAKKANAFEFIDSFPEKFETLVGERGIQLSGGQRQRIAIARAVLKNPSILILDEATSSLDSESERLVQNALDKLMIGRTSIVIAHRLSTIRKADKIIVIDKGEVVETGTHEQLIENDNGLYKSLSKLQYEGNLSLK